MSIFFEHVMVIVVQCTITLLGLHYFTNRVITIIEALERRVEKLEPGEKV